MTLAGSFAGILPRAASAAARTFPARVIFFWAAGISVVFLTAALAVLRAGLSMTFVLVSTTAI